MEKYLVFRLERPFGGDLNVTEACFELVKEFETVSEVYRVDNKSEAEVYADQYSKDHNLRTLVLKGSVFG